MTDNPLDALPPSTTKLVRSVADHVVRYHEPAGLKSSPFGSIAAELGYYVGLMIPMLMPKCSDPDSLRAYEKAGKPNTTHFERAVKEALAERAVERLAGAAAPPAGPED